MGTLISLSAHRQKKRQASHKLVLEKFASFGDDITSEELEYLGFMLESGELETLFCGITKDLATHILDEDEFPTHPCLATALFNGESL